MKPGNLFLTQRRNGTPLIKVLDFGIAKAPDEGDMSLTDTDAVIGSPAYMAPEQIRASKNADERSDIWSLGVILYELASEPSPIPEQLTAQSRTTSSPATYATYASTSSAPVSTTLGSSSGAVSPTRASLAWRRGLVIGGVAAILVGAGLGFVFGSLSYDGGVDTKPAVRTAPEMPTLVAPATTVTPAPPIATPAPAAPMEPAAPQVMVLVGLLPAGLGVYLWRTPGSAAVVTPRVGVDQASVSIVGTF